MNISVHLNSLDSESTLLYKLSHAFDTPVKFIILSKPRIEEVIGLSYLEKLKRITAEKAGDVIIRELSQGAGIQEIVDKYISLSLLDIIMIWYIYNESKGNFNSEHDREIVVDRFNEVYQVMNISSITNYSDVEAKRSEWGKKYEASMIFDTKIYNQIEAFQSDLEHVDTSVVYISSINFVKIKTQSNLKYNNAETSPTVSDGIDIFNMSHVSYDIPYLVYNSNNKKYTKLYEGLNTDTRPNYNKVIPESGSTESNDTLYLTLWSGEGNPIKATQKSYSLASYHIPTNELAFTYNVIPNIDENLSIIKLTNALGLSAINVTDIRATGNFRIYGMIYDELTLNYFIMNDDTASTYLYINESTVSYPFKRRVKYHYRSVLENITEIESQDNTTTSSSISFSLSQHFLNYKTPTNLYPSDNPNNLSSVTTQDLKEGHPYIEVNIDKAVSREIILHFVGILTRLLFIYQSERHGPTEQNLVELYYNIIPNFGGYINEYEHAKKKDIVKQKGSTKWKPSGIKPGELLPGYDLSSVDKLPLMKERTHGSGLSDPGYARVAQAKNQPLTLDPSEVDAWKQSTYIGGDGHVKNRIVLDFEGINGEGVLETWHFVCPTDEFPVIDLKVNPVSNNNHIIVNGVEKLHREVFPQVPHCYRSSHVTKSGKSAKNPKYVITRMTVLQPNRLGAIDDQTVNRLLGLNLSGYKFHRRGVISSPNSFIHSVLMACDLAGVNCISNNIFNVEIYQHSDMDQKEYMVKDFRKRLVEYITPSLLRQENFNSSDSEILNRMTNPEVFFDPSLYYRVIEELFNINVYTFSHTDEKKTAISLELPRYREFYSKINNNERLTIIIYKHILTETSNTTYSQCELIYAKGQNNSIPNINLFDVVTNQLLYDLTIASSTSITWNISPYNNEPIAYSNLYSMSDFVKLIGLPEYQIIDTYGKSRGFVYTIDNKLMTVMIIPSRPENITSIDKDDPRLLNRVSLDTVLSVFQDNITTAYTKEILGTGRKTDPTDERINGIWIKIYDIEHGIYVPFESISLSEFQQKVFVNSEESQSNMLLLGPPNPITANSFSVIERTRRLRRTFEIVMQFIYWAFLSSNMNIESFIQQYIESSDNTLIGIDSTTIYDIRGVPRKLPKVNANEAIEYINKVMPSLIRNDMFYLYSKKFRDGIIYLLRQYERSIRGLTRVIPTELDGLYQEESDFNQQENTAIFLSNINMKSWITTVANAGDYRVKIKKELDISFGNLTEPYLYMTENDKNIYMIQNVMGSDKMIALNVALNWYTKRINLGFRAPPYNIDSTKNTLPAHFVYFISNDNQPFAQNDFTAGEQKFIQILSYTENSYAAMLPIL